MNYSLLQHGIGIDIQEGNFTALCVKRQWTSFRVEDRLEIPQYQAAGAQECGRLYGEFLRRNGLKMPWTVVALPRSAVLLRWLNFPPAAEKELAQAVQFQLDSLHPFEEDAIYWDFASWKMPGDATGGTSIEAPVAIAEKSFVDQTAAWFQEAGIGISQFTVTTAALLSAFGQRMATLTPDQPRNGREFFLLHAGERTIQVIGHASGSLVSKEFPLPNQANSHGKDKPDAEDDLFRACARELALARSELRIEPEERAPLLVCGPNAAIISDQAAGSQFAVCAAEQLFPGLPSNAQDFRLERDAIAFGAGLMAADRSLAPALNLLPADRRSYQSPLIYVPAYALTALIAILVLALGLRGTYQDWRYGQYIEQQIQSLQPQLAAVESAQEHSRKASQRLALLDGVRSSATLPIGILNELTRILPDDAWLTLLQFDGDTLSITGTAKSASPLLEKLAGSSYFENPQFLSAIARNSDGQEVFRIGVRVRRNR